jgi:ParB family chromosome partitioning protein
MSATKRKAMGRGLSALLKDTGEVHSATDKDADKLAGAIAEIEIVLIRPNPDQPRTQFNKEALQELAISISELGIIQPITVRKNSNDTYTIISGERRYRAAKLAGLKAIPAYIRIADDQSMLEMALVENIQREELDPVEIALSYQRLIEECDLTQESMSDRVGKKRSTITNYLRLLKLQPIIQAGLRDKMISMGHARAMVNIDDEDLQLDLYQQIIEKDLSVRQVEEAVRKLRENRAANASKGKPAGLPEKFIELRRELSDYLNTEVSVSRNKRGRGKLSINFRSDEDLERILRLIES